MSLLLPQITDAERNATSSLLEKYKNPPKNLLITNERSLGDRIEGAVQLAIMALVMGVLGDPPPPSM